MPGPPRGTAGGQKREVGIGRGSLQRVYVLGADGLPQAVGGHRRATPTARLTELTGDSLSEGALVITGQLAATGERK